jgi:hypothetical protein
MKAIFDQIEAPKIFPLFRLLENIKVYLGIPPEKLVEVHRVGGVGKSVWKYESTLNDGRQLALSFYELEQMAADAQEYPDELLCAMDGIYFGISDASFLFVQAFDKNVESKTLNQFINFRDIPDAIVIKTNPRSSQ